MPRAFVHAPCAAGPPRSRADEVTLVPEAAACAPSTPWVLTCPLLHASIDALEKRGGIDDLAVVAASGLRSA